MDSQLLLSYVLQNTYLIPLSLPLVLLWLVWFLWQRYFESSSDPASPYPLPRGDMGWPLVGNTLNLMWNPKTFMEARQKKYGPVFKLHIFGTPTVVVVGSDYFRTVTNMEHTGVTNKWPYTTRTLLGPGAMSTMEDPMHKTRRKLVLSAFNHTNLSLYAVHIHQIVQNHIKAWSKMGTLKFVNEAKSMTLSLAWEILVGLDLSTKQQRELSHEFEEFERGLFCLAVNFPGFQFHKSLRSKEVLKSKMKDQIKALRESTAEKKPTVCSRILANTSDTDDMSMDDLCEAMIELVFAGHDTTASAISSTVIALGRHPHVVEKLRAEIREFNADGDEGVPFDVMVRMPYLNAVMTEVLLQSPPVGGGYRQTLKTIDIGGYQIPKGWKVRYSIRETHANLTDGQFSPERWLPKDPANVDNTPEPSTITQRDIFPFGGGPRACVGKEFARLVLRSLILELVKNCDIQLLNPGMKMSYFPLPLPTDGLPIRLTERKNKYI